MSFDGDSKANEDVSSVSTEEDVNGDFCDASTDEDDSTLNSDDDSISDENDEEVVLDLVHVSLCENYINELKFNSIYKQVVSFNKNIEKGIETNGVMPGSFFGKIGIEAGFLNKYRVFKVNYGFYEDGGYPEDLSDKNFKDLYLYSIDPALL